MAIQFLDSTDFDRRLQKRLAEQSELFVLGLAYSDKVVPQRLHGQLIYCCSYVDALLKTVVISSDSIADNQLQVLLEGGLSLEDIASELNTVLIDFSKPLILQTCAIKKPWGQEIWYTGVEERGVSQIGDGRLFIPLPWLYRIAPALFFGAGFAKELMLLKILDPLAQPVYGDLYFELHEKKQEVYVVTHIDQTAWPEGRGAIRFGFSDSVRQNYSCDEDFLAAYRHAVKRYQAIRKSVDGVFDQLRVEQSLAANEPVDAEQLKIWDAQLPSDLRQQEREARAAMDAFTQLLPLSLGDVVKVPCLTPHSLQHGVRTIEFQTPVYERLILSFAQKVLTQTDWDTDEAISKLNVSVPKADDASIIESGVGYELENIVDFPDFSVQRLSLESGCLYTVNAESYYLIMPVGDSVVVNHQVLLSEQASVMTASSPLAEIHNPLETKVIVLLAFPKKN